MSILFQVFNPRNILLELLTLSTWGRWFAPITSILIIYLSIQWGSTWWEILSAVSGVLCVVLVADRKLTNFFWGIINCSLYGLSSYNNSFFGDMSLNWFIYIPFQFIGLYMWYRNTDGDNSVEANALGMFQLAACAAIVVGCVFIGYVILDSLNGNHPIADSSNVVLSLMATVLMAFRFREQWMCWIMVNLTGIWMWYSNIEADGAPIAPLLMWVAFLVNSCYGYYSWSKQQRMMAREDDGKRRSFSFTQR